jgi:hypothetical protein
MWLLVRGSIQKKVADLWDDQAKKINVVHCTRYNLPELQPVEIRSTSYRKIVRNQR